MNAFVSIIPLFFIRFGLIGLINKQALHRAAHFAPLKGNEKIAYYLYQISNVFIILYPLALKIQTTLPLFFVAICVYLTGMAVLLISSVSFAKPRESGLNVNGAYRLSRNPMYVGYFIYFLGCVLLTHSWLLLIALLVFQIAAHWIIRAEERWCVSQFGEEYILYMNRVRRYL